MVYWVEERSRTKEIPSPRLPRSQRTDPTSPVLYSESRGLCESRVKEKKKVHFLLMVIVIR